MRSRTPCFCCWASMPTASRESRPSDAPVTTIRLGTRGSRLAVTQSQGVADLISERLGRTVELVRIRTMGDDLAGPLSAAPAPGVFVSALRDALLAGYVDVVVHSMKDLPSAPVPGITLAAVPPREDSRDVLITHARCDLASLPSGARVGTSSPRRAAQLRALRPDLDIVDLRGNVDTRIERVRSGELDAAVLAAAGIRRIGREAEIDDVLDDLMPAPAQGALAVEVRSDDAHLVDALAGLDDAPTRRQVMAEREVLAGLAATCTSAVAASSAHREGEEPNLLLSARVDAAAHANTRAVECRIEGHVPLHDDRAARDLGEIAARVLLGRGAGDLLHADGWPGRSETGATVVWVTRPATGARADVEALRAAGACVLEAPVLRVRPDVSASGAAHRLLDAISGDATLVAVTSAAAVDALVALVGESAVREAFAQASARGVRMAAVGQGTASSLTALGAHQVLVPSVQDSEAMLEMLDDITPGIAVLPRGNLAMRGLQEGLEAAGWSVLAEQVYVTEPTEVPEGVVDAVASGAVDVIVLRSPSAVRAVRDAMGSRPLPDSCSLVVGGRTTAGALEREWPNHGGRMIASQQPSPAAVAEAVLSASATTVKES